MSQRARFGPEAISFYTAVQQISLKRGWTKAFARQDLADDSSHPLCNVDGLLRLCPRNFHIFAGVADSDGKGGQSGRFSDLAHPIAFRGSQLQQASEVVRVGKVNPFPDKERLYIISLRIAGRDRPLTARGLVPPTAGHVGPKEGLHRQSGSIAAPSARFPQLGRS